MRLSCSAIALPAQPTASHTDEPRADEQRLHCHAATAIALPAQPAVSHQQDLESTAAMEAQLSRGRPGPPHDGHNDCGQCLRH